MIPHSAFCTNIHISNSLFQLRTANTDHHQDINDGNTALHAVAYLQIWKGGGAQGYTSGVHFQVFKL